MGLPNLSIVFKTQAAATIAQNGRGVVGVMVRDTTATGGYTLPESKEIPAGLGEDNQKYISNAMIGYIDRPRKVLLYVLSTEAEDLSGALDWFGANVPDYLVGPPDTSSEEADAIVDWVKARRQENLIPKAVLPNKAADNEAIINFTTEEILAGGKTYTTAQYCSRMAGLIAGTPLNIACTNAPLTEVEKVKALGREAMDEAIDAGQLIIWFDGQKVKVGRGVNSFQHTTADKSAIFKKIKIVELVDLIQRDIRIAVEDGYIGKYPNTYDNKLLLISAILGYFKELEADDLLVRDASTVDIDVAAQTTYLQSQGVDVSAMDEMAIRKANTQDQVFLTASISVLDAIEDIKLVINL